MKIVSTQFTLSNNSLEVYFSGCYGNCKNCHNSEIKSFDIGDDYKNVYPKLSAKIKNYDDIIKQLWILGGDPLDQDKDKFKSFLEQLKKDFPNKEIVLFTRYELDDVADFVKENCDFIKTGVYEETLPVTNPKENIEQNYGILLATTNQRVNKKGVDYV